MTNIACFAKLQIVLVAPRIERLLGGTKGVVMKKILLGLAVVVSAVSFGDIKIFRQTSEVHYRAVIEGAEALSFFKRLAEGSQIVGHGKTQREIKHDQNEIFCNVSGEDVALKIDTLKVEELKPHCEINFYDRSSGIGGTEYYSEVEDTDPRPNDTFKAENPMAGTMMLANFDYPVDGTRESENEIFSVSNHGEPVLAIKVKIEKSLTSDKMLKKVTFWMNGENVKK